MVNETGAPGSSPSTAASGAYRPRLSIPRMVTHPRGAAAVLSHPNRVVALAPGALDSLIALGVTPVGATTPSREVDFPRYLGDGVRGIANVGTVPEPDLDAIAALGPDLILSCRLRQWSLQERLAQIAPTVVCESEGAGWKHNLQLYAAALKKPEASARVLADYDERVGALREAMGPRLAETRVSVLRSFPTHVRAYMKRSFIGGILADIRLPRLPWQSQDAFAKRANPQRIPDLDGDVIFLLYYNRQKGEQLSTLMAQPQWSQLKAVREGRVYEAEDAVWGLGLGPLAARLVIDDLFRYLVA